MANMHLQLTGNLVGNTTSEELAGQIVGAADVLIPGAYFGDVVQVTANEEDPTFVVVETDLVTDEFVPSGDYSGQKVTQDFVTDYVLGAGPHWVSNDGGMFAPVGAIAEFR